MSIENTTKFYFSEHVDYIDEETQFELVITEHLRMSAIYWAVTCLDLLNGIDRLPKDEILIFVLKCQNLDDVKGLQQKDGSFSGDKWGEIDTRFSYCALNCLALLGESDKEVTERAVEFVLTCQNFDGGFGVVPRAESHGGQIFCCVGVLAMGNALDRINIDRLCFWLAERQVENGGLNGRPEKLADVCYSWWILSALCMCDRLDWINQSKLQQFILNCQDEAGGISDKPGNMPDVFHTYFGVGGLSLMRAQDGLKMIDPIYALPVDTLSRLGIVTPFVKRFLKE